MSSKSNAMGLFSRFLTIWIFLAIAMGIALGSWMPKVFQEIGSIELAHINLAVAILVLVMILPMLLKIDFTSLHEVWQQRRGIAVTLGVNWLFKPFFMALLGYIFIYHVFISFLDAKMLDGYFAGLVILAAAPCTAMVFVWSKLTQGDAQFTLSQVALNDVVMVFAFAPIVALLLGFASVTIPWDTLLLSVLIYILAPVLVAYLWRKHLLKRGAFDIVLKRVDPLSMAALLLTVVLLFAFQGQQILRQPLVIAILAVPIVIQVYVTFGLAYLLNRRLGVQHNVAAPSALIGASNFFELAVATAIALFGFESGAALATVVGVLVEVPVMLTLVFIVNQSKIWYEKDIT
ncbi:MAG: ACR3 family arsenite efflux transporter [Mariprofundaceae bacterium]|nr:ACR3 family arsenite efflux transporter [Mariprofundaceae bacterium]